MSRKGDPYDNAVAEYFFSCLNELIHLRRFMNRSAAQNAVFSYIESFYNSVCSHSAIGWIPPNIFASRFSLTAIA